jgi:acetyltransferase-like isoleucine patch superfamily enzyme
MIRLDSAVLEIACSLLASGTGAAITSSRRCQDRSVPIEVLPIRIGKNVWIAAGSAVLKGVRIGDNSVVAYGSVVTRDVDPDAIVAGNPARLVGSVPA